MMSSYLENQNRNREAAQKAINDWCDCLMTADGQYKDAIMKDAIEMFTIKSYGSNEMNKILTQFLQVREILSCFNDKQFR